MSKKHEETNVLVQTNDPITSALSIREDALVRAQALKDLGITATDLVIPMVQLMQGTSALVGDGKMRLGDIVNMQTEEKLGDIEVPVQVLPLKLFKTLRTYSVADSGFKFLHEAPLTPDNDRLPNEAMEDGVPVKRFHTLNCFVLLKTDVDAGSAFPCLIRFKSTGMNAGRALATHVYKLWHHRKAPYSQYVELSCRREKKDTATYAVFGIGKPTEADDAAKKSAEEWLATLATMSYRVDDREESDVVEDRVKAAKPVVVSGVSQGEY